MNLIEIFDVEDERLDIFARLREKQLIHFYEPNGGVFIAESPKVVERALDGGYVPVSALVEDRQIGEASNLLERLGEIPIYTSDFDTLTSITGFKLTRGMLCAFMRRKLPACDEVCKNAKRIAVLEEVVNPTNVGAIFRSAAALNMDGVILTGGYADPLYRRAIRVSMGTVFQIPWTYLPDDLNWAQNGTRYMNLLGFKTVAMALAENTLDIDDKSLNSQERLAIIMGTEGDGLSKNTIENSDYTVKIPMSHGVDSLNVAAASAVAFWQLGRNKN